MPGPFSTPIAGGAERSTKLRYSGVQIATFTQISDASTLHHIEVVYLGRSPTICVEQFPRNLVY
jgi:hypothetical protein